MSQTQSDPISSTQHAPMRPGPLTSGEVSLLTQFAQWIKDEEIQTTKLAASQIVQDYAKEREGNPPGSRR